MSDLSRTRTVFDALTLPARLLRAGFAEGENARVRVDADAYVLDLDLPGFDTDAFDVSWEDGYLTVAATAADRSYEESFHFPSVVRPSEISATYDADEGVLTVTLPVYGRRPSAGSTDAPERSHGIAD
ncbi:Hsp20/alpha crystallin family protein [Haloglomus litoreum]|uniref:Hsp20/alpha crystallin family protein n=1 Tax=Haloglomus litoreum TaxID=3034026 RepID=UPI0023E8F632|nr:Hsp20/alpha crystallin family protein [Haloglomus sp. DT116]